MKIQSLQIILPEGTFNTTAISFEEIDKKKLKQMITLWSELSQQLKSLGARGVNIPEGISEPLYCLAMNYEEIVRITKSISGANTSFDCYHKNTHERIQVKACSVLPDLSSFGPKSQFDKLAFLDLSDISNGNFKIFDIPPALIYNHNVNSTQTFIEQQREKRRPRFSIFKDIIEKHNLHPTVTGNINEW